ncbi:MAG: ATP-binding protein [Candidatus Nanopelagicales bacterium]
MKHQLGLTTRLFAGQLIVVFVGAATLLLTAAIVAPRVFADHLARSGEDTPGVQLHVRNAFESSFALSMLVATIAAGIAAGFLSWFLARRVARPISELAAASESVAAGNYQVAVPRPAFGQELSALSLAFGEMADQLASTDATRARMLADLAHELRTPLATLEAYIDGVEDKVVPASPESFATMREQVTRLRRLSNDLREAAAAQEGALHVQLTAQPIQPIVSKAVAGGEPRFAAKSVNLVNSGIVGEGVLVAADGDRLQQVLANLLDNALRHTPSGGSVRVHCTTTPTAVEIRVIDDGDGIPAEHLDSIFERFHRVDESRAFDRDGGGSGLGLTIARAIVIDHHGTLTATSAGTDTGTTIRMQLPRC